ncbi:MAG: VCBS repeat-containing protein [Acidimicrobiia bacterium]|nr:VCBS repeat-containing protein [Acidimicrobiia bacterium]
MIGESVLKLHRVAVVLLVAAGLCLPVQGAAVATGGGGGGGGDYLKGPVWARNYADWNRTSSPTIADISGDGVPEILFGSQDGWVQVLNADGNSIAGWPQPVVVDPGTGRHATAIDSSPTVADLDRDGKPEVIVGAGSNWPRANNKPGGIVVFRSDGSVKCRARMVPEFGYDSVYSTPAVGDVDGDGYSDFVFGSFNHRIHALDRNCNELPGFPYFQDDTIWASPVVYDVDRDGRAEVFIGCDSTAGGPVDWQGGIFRRLDWQNGGVVQVWQRAIHDTFYSSAALGDIDGDGRLELVTGAGDFFHHPDSRKVWAFHADNGSDVPGWPQDTGGTTTSAPAIGDLDGDGKAREVAIGSTDGNVYAFRGNGQRMWVTRPSTGTTINPSPIIADLTGDGAEDVVIGNDGATFLIDGPTGREKQRVGVMWSYETSAALGKFGSRGWRLVTAAINTPLKTSRLEVHAVRAPGRTPSWPMWRKNARHTGAPASRGRVTPLPPATATARPTRPMRRRRSRRAATGSWAATAASSPSVT